MSPEGCVHLHPSECSAAAVFQDFDGGLTVKEHGAKGGTEFFLVARRIHDLSGDDEPTVYLDGGLGVVGLVLGVAFFGALAHDGGRFELFEAVRPVRSPAGMAQAVAQRDAVGIGGVARNAAIYGASVPPHVRVLMVPCLLTLAKI